MNKTVVVLGSAHQGVSRERALAGLVYAKKNDISRIILSGGLGESGKTEAVMMKDIIIGVHRNFGEKLQIILEGTSRNTDENLRNIDKIENGGFFSSPENYILVSSRSQLFRLRGDLEGMDRAGAEEILSQKLGNKSKTHKHHLVYWGYEILRPLKQIIPQKSLEKWKKTLKKV